MVKISRNSERVLISDDADREEELIKILVEVSDLFVHLEEKLMQGERIEIKIEKKAPESYLFFLEIHNNEQDILEN